MRIKLLYLTCFIVTSLPLGAQTLDKMNWFNEPEQWSISGNRLSMTVTPKSDYWRISHYGFTVDDAPFYYSEYGREFEAKVKISGDYKVRFDQAGMMIRIDHENYIKSRYRICGWQIQSKHCGYASHIGLERNRTGATRRIGMD